MQDTGLLVYIAGPLFTPAERAYLEKLSAMVVLLGFRTYLPHRDAGLARAFEKDRRRFFAADIAALEAAAMVVAVLNGADVDSGTAFELGYARAKGKALFGIYEDTRIGDPLVDINLMVVNSTLICRSREELCGMLKNTRVRRNRHRKQSQVLHVLVASKLVQKTSMPSCST